ncbi:hypothetical protein [Nocardia seriolae]|uniref:hypothetical protein n=1 Tax=Nocardia seriolae TaxID=37332 RepID=UPI0008FF62AA|nr:hypothetical protein [Nocardia seriolae]OJF83647.1 hypothetical protein NS14008_36750 [Nocardia seriolae]PSK29385.1 hypothetical protein C6575_21530 [Nocardia seriolae]QOW32448.1 hypothetical protein IMZ23_31485 [Nocardia seriolae]QUN20057.1 hypothetical protein KEC46_12545 [Nocardia seriolae]WNJ59541.1 hypothetical protein RMO66_01430 [Nocardia seriolae]
MTSSEPGPGGPQDPQKAQETAQWWATPPTGTDPGQPLQGADPTMLNYAAGGGTYTPPAQPIPPSQSGGGYPQQPPVTGGGYQQPVPPMQSGGFPQQQYAQPQYAAPQQFTPPPPVPPGAPGYGYAPQPPRSGGNKNGWIIGGVIGLVVIVGAIIGVVALSGSDSSPLGGDKKKNAGKYTMDGVTNGCTVIDTSVLSKWAANSKGTPEHSETKPTDYSGGRFECRAGNEETSKTDKYSSSTNTADLTLDVAFLSGSSSAYNRPEYDLWKTSDTGTTGSGRTSGDVSGIGEAGYWTSKVDDYTYFTSTDYTCAVKDDNASVKVEFRLTMYKGKDVSKDDLATACKEQVRKALQNIKKK